MGSALTEVENWDLRVDCTSGDGRQMLDAGVPLSDKRTLLMKTHIPFQTQYKIFYESASAFTNGEETTDSIISKMLSNLSCLVFDRSCNEKNQIRFLMKGEKISFKENIPAFSVQGKSGDNHPKHFRKLIM